MEWTRAILTGWLSALLVAWGAAGSPCWAIEGTVRVEFTGDAKQPPPRGQVMAEVIVEYPDSSRLLRTADGQLWTLASDDIVSIVECDGDRKSVV